MKRVVFVQLDTYLRTIVLIYSVIAVNSLSLPQEQRESSNDGKENPLEIKVHFLLHHAVINEDDHDMTLTMDVIEEWTHDNQSNSIAQPEASTDVHVATGKFNGTEHATPNEITLVNTGDSTILKTMTRSMQDGRIMRLTKLQINTPCIMNFFYFPFEKQTCSLKFLPGESSDKEIKLMASPTSPPAKLLESDDISLYPLRKYKINQFLMNDDFGVFNQSGIELQLMFVRQAERSFPFLYFPVIALMTISIISLYVKSTLNSIYLTLASFLTMIVFVVGCQPLVSHTGFTTLLDHYHFLCLNLSLNAVSVSIMLHLFLQAGSKGGNKVEESASESEQTGTLLEDVKLELNTIPSITGNGLSSKTVSNSSKDEKSKQAVSDKPEEAHIYKMGKIKQFIYFKSVKTAKHQLPIIFLLINVIYWIWVLIARLYVPSGFINF